MAICIFDFIIAPVAASILITFYKSTIPVWTALSLQSGGLIHVAFGAILGITAWGRTREREIEYGQSYGGGQYNSPYPPSRYPPSTYPPVPVRTVTTETTIVGNSNNKPLPPRPRRQE
jgi:hypothetical protein